MMPQTGSTTSSSTKPTPYYYTALVRVPKENVALGRGQYYLVSIELSSEQLDAYNRGENIKTQLDTVLETELRGAFAEEAMDHKLAKLYGKEGEVTQLNPGTIAFSSGVEAEQLSHLPHPKFKFIKKFMLDVVERTDLVASTPHRLTAFFKPDFMPDTTYFWLFTGLVIGSGIISLGRILKKFFGFSQEASKEKKDEANNNLTGFVLCNSTISWGNPIPAEASSRTKKIAAWADYAFKFLGSFSLWYWVIWSIAEVTVGAGLAVVPFGPLIAFLIPLLFTLVQKFADPAINYVFNKENKASEQNLVNLAILKKLELLEKAVGEKDNLSLNQHLTHINQILEENAAKTLSFNQTLINKPSARTQRTRIALSTLMGFGKGFAMTALIFFALSAFMGTGVGAVITPFIVAAVVGIAYAAKAYRESSHLRAQHDKAFESLEERNEQLLNKLNRFYQIILEKRQQASSLSETLGEKFTPFAAAVDNQDFMFNSKLVTRGWHGKLWQKIKERAHLFIIFIGATESGSFIFRTVFSLVIGLATLGLVSNPLSLTVIGAIMASIAIGWGIAKLCHHWSQTVISQENLFLTQSEVYIRTLDQEYHYLEKHLQELQIRAADLSTIENEPSLGSRHIPTGEIFRHGSQDYDTESLSSAISSGTLSSDDIDNTSDEEETGSSGEKPKEHP